MTPDALTLHRAMETDPPTPHYCYSWLKAEDFIRHALASYYAACRYVEAGSREFPDGPHASKENWMEDLQNIFKLRIQCAATDAGIPGYEESKKWLEGYLEPTPSENIPAIGDIALDIHSSAFKVPICRRPLPWRSVQLATSYAPHPRRIDQSSIASTTSASTV